MSHTADFLAVDLGASSGRVMLGRWDGARFELHELHRFTNTPVSALGQLRWDVLALWDAIKTGMARTANYGGTVAGIGVDTWGVDFALLDRAGNLLGNPWCYRDGRTSGMLEQVFARVSRERVFATTGIQFMQINTLYQLFSMAQAGDPQLEIAQTLLLMPDLFHYWLSGVAAVEYTDATTTQCLDARARGWAGDMLGELGIPTHFLPPLIEPGSVLGPLRTDLLTELGLRGPIQVIAPGGHDTASAVAAIPGLDDTSVYISSGTWSLVGVETDAPVISDEALRLNFTNEGGVAGTFRLLKNVMGLWLLQECQRQWQREGHSYSVQELLVLAERAPAFRSLVDPDAPEFLFPGDMPAAIRARCRQTGQPEPADVGAVVRCCLESLALRYRWVVDALESLTGRRYTTVRVVGGGSQSKPLCQYTADACGRPVLAGPVEATALGNVMVQAIATGHLPNLAAGRQAIAASAEIITYEPHPSDAWTEAFMRFRQLIG